MIGAVIGGYMGGSIANDENFNPLKWDWSSSKTWGYMLGGATIGGFSSVAGATIASSGIPFANTLGMATASFSNSLGMNVITGGKTPISINFGVTSFDISNREWGIIGKKGNSFLENLSYFMGAMANTSDILAGLKPTTAKLATENDPNFMPELGKGDFIGHSQLGIGDDVIID